MSSPYSSVVNEVVKWYFLSFDIINIQTMAAQTQQQPTVEANKLRYKLSQSAGAQGESGLRVRWFHQSDQKISKHPLLLFLRKAGVAYILLIIFMLIAWSSILIGKAMANRKFKIDRMISQVLSSLSAWTDITARTAGASHCVGELSLYCPGCLMHQMMYLLSTEKQEILTSYWDVNFLRSLDWEKNNYCLNCWWRTNIFVITNIRVNPDCNIFFIADHGTTRAYSPPI